MRCPVCGGLTRGGRLYAVKGKVEGTYPPSFDVTHYCKGCNKHFGLLNLRDGRKTFFEIKYDERKHAVSYTVLSQVSPPALTIYSGYSGKESV